MNNYGVVLKRLRVIKQLSLKQAAVHIGKSAGWLSEVENGQGYSRLKPEEFERLVAAYDGHSLRLKFAGWMASETKLERKGDISFDGAILKYLREKANLSLDGASQKLGLSKRYLSNLENGHKPIKLSLRERLMRAYNYSPSSFKNFASEDKRAGNIPVKYKLNILLNQVNDEILAEVLDFAIQKAQNRHANSQ